MKTIILALFTSSLVACGGSAANGATNSQQSISQQAASVSVKPQWELLIPIPNAPDVEVFKASINGYSGLVEGNGKDTVARLYDACSFIISNAKNDNSVYRNMMSAEGQIVKLNDSVCVAKLERDGLHLEVK